VPEWIAVQEEYLSAKRLRSEVDALRASAGSHTPAGQRMPARRHERRADSRGRRPGCVQPRFTITSPMDGVVVGLETHRRAENDGPPWRNRSFV